MNPKHEHASFREKTLLSMAGFDPSGGAGVLADCRVFAYYGFRAAGVITAMTVQGPQSVKSVRGVERELIHDSMQVLFEQVKISAVKIGMLWNREIVEEVSRSLDLVKPKIVVLDPVLAASDGTPLITDEGVEAMVELLFPRATHITPNVPEAQQLTGVFIHDDDSLEEAGALLLAKGPGAVIIKGGHREGKPIDWLITGEKSQPIYGERIPASDVHGTGCMFSSALAANLVLLEGNKKAVQQAKAYVTEQIHQEHSLHGKGNH